MDVLVIRRVLFRFILLLGTAFPVTPAAAQTVSGKVVGVSDGDSLTLLVQGNRQIKVRLEGIDAPETGQEFSRELEGRTFSAGVW